MTTSSVWHALLGGALIGLACAIALLAHGRIAGISSILGNLLRRDDGQPFRLAFLGGLLAVGGALHWVAPAAIGGPVRELPLVVMAGVAVGYGTARGNGCTSGHGVCGLGLGSPRSLVAVVTFIAAGMLTATLLGGGT